MNPEFSLSRIERQRYRPAAHVEELLENLRFNLVPGEKYRIARLAIARSVAEPIGIETLPEGTEMGTAIEGQVLFGDDVASWSCLVVQSAGTDVIELSHFKKLVEAHWSRGAQLLYDEWERVGMRVENMILSLAGLAGTGSLGRESVDLNSSTGPIDVSIGERSTNLKSGKPVSVVLNGPGISPHCAVLGKTRSGKTRTGIVMAEQIASKAGVPLLFIDPKGEFVRDGRLVQKSEWGGRTLADRFPGIQAIDVANQVVPLDFLKRDRDSSQASLSALALGFKDSFQKTIKSRGDVALDSLREIVLNLLESDTPAISLEDIHSAVRDYNSSAGRKKDSIEARLNEICSVSLFAPTLSPPDFFSRKWVIGLGGCSEDARRLVMFLLLDALSRFLLGLQDSSVDSMGNRGLRHLLVVDEAREILSYRHNALSELLRKSAAKGGVVMLLSQSPDDFEQESEDFLSQVGTIAVFASTTSSVKNLAAAVGRNKIQPGEFSDKELPPGVALVKLPNQELTKLIAWEK